jgi:enoyl-CoA hydratase/carnithine racemase
MSLTGAYLDAATAADWGLANEAVADADLMARASAVATEIAETDRTAMDKIRALMKAGSGQPMNAALAMETEVFDTHIATVTPGAVNESRARVQARGKRIAGGSA